VDCSQVLLVVDFKRIQRDPAVNQGPQILRAALHRRRAAAPFTIGEDANDAFGGYDAGHSDIACLYAAVHSFRSAGAGALLVFDRGCAFLMEAPPRTAWDPVPCWARRSIHLLRSGAVVYC